MYSNVKNLWKAYAIVGVTVVGITGVAIIVDGLLSSYQRESDEVDTEMEVEYGNSY